MTPPEYLPYGPDIGNGTIRFPAASFFKGCPQALQDAGIGLEYDAMGKA